MQQRTLVDGCAGGPVDGAAAEGERDRAAGAHRDGRVAAQPGTLQVDRQRADVAQRQFQLPPRGGPVAELPFQRVPARGRFVVCDRADSGTPSGLAAPRSS